MKNQPLLPELITKDDDAYSVVEDLNEALNAAFEQEKIRNIALTGPYGSGKSSILETLITTLPEERKPLHISLATLRVDDTTVESDNHSLSPKEREEAEEALNRKIEYSILQQLIYHEKAQSVPNSRLRRIIHMSSKRLCQYSCGVIGFILAFFIAFEPSWARIETLYSFLNWGQWNVIPDILAVSYMLVVVMFAVWKLIPNYANSKLNKFSLKDASIELNEDTSIFNRHLDEILYFFQATKYDIVIIEDLDRFCTSKIFLKLRELNFLLNESNVIGRHIVFLYAVKDDLFKDEERTKFFDFISIVIPVINSSNSKDKLKKALEDRGFNEGFPDNDLSEIAFFIQDMRILKNIANEFAQYYKLLSKKNGHLDKIKLLAMIVYKNYHPQDFAMLHRRQGKVYQCLDKKADFIKLALKEVEKKKVELAELKQRKEENAHLQEIDLRTLLLEKLRSQFPNKFYRIQLGDEFRTLSEIATDSKLFEKLMELTNMRYEYWDYYNQISTSLIDINTDVLKKEMNYDSRLEAIRTTLQQFIDKEQSLARQEMEIRSYTFQDLLSYLDLQECEEYTKIELSPMMDVFLRLGYLNEEYYDYISYFYEGMITQNDHDLLLSIKRKIVQLPATPIDKIENFYKELQPYMFQHKAILNNNLVDYIAHYVPESFELIMKVIEKKDVPLEFLAQYYLLGSEQQRVFEHFITWGKKKSWDIIAKHNNETERAQLQEAWLRFSGDIVPASQDWLNKNFLFLESHYEGIGKERSLKLCSESEFEKIGSSNNDLIDCIIENSAYTINTHNLQVIVAYLTKESVDIEKINYSWCLQTNNSVFIQYVNDNLEECLKLFSDEGKKENEKAILALLNCKEITPDFKKQYLSGQENKLPDYNGIAEEGLGLATQLFLIEPTWENIIWYFKKMNDLTSELSSYILHYEEKLSKLTATSQEDMQAFFESFAICPDISTTALSKLLKAFSANHLDGIDVSDLDSERLKLLLENGKFSFTDENTKALQETDVFGAYLIANYTAMLDNISPDFFAKSSVSREVLTSEKFSLSQKEDILKAIPSSHLYSSEAIANEAIKVIINQTTQEIDKDVLVEIVKKSTLKNMRLCLVTKMIISTSDNEEIADLLNLLGGIYSEIAKREKHPKLEMNAENKALLKILKDKGFISSYPEDKDGSSWRTYYPKT
jgi:hypothetical protein